MKIDKYSASRGQTFEWCDWKYYLTYELGKREELYKGRYYFAFGNTVHDTLEYYALNGIKCDWRSYLIKMFNEHRPFEGIQNLGKKVTQQFFIDKTCKKCKLYNKKNKTCDIMGNAAVDDFDGCPLKVYQNAVEMIEVTIERYHGYFKTGLRTESNPKGKILGVEQEFNLSLGKDDDGQDILITGFIDLVVEADKETIDIIDYKTGSPKTTQELITKDVQSRLYGYVATQLYPNYKYHILTFDYLKDTPVPICFTKKNLESVKSEVIQQFKEIKKRQPNELTRLDNTWICQYMCNWDNCSKYWDKFQNGIMEV